jgi:type IV secretion system protein TrbL
MERFIDDITAAFLSALQTGGQTLATYSLGILSIAAVIGYYRTIGARLLQGGGSLSDALGTPLLYFITVGGYYYGITRLHDIGVAALQTFVLWGTQGSGSSFDVSLLQKPSFILETGLKAAKPIADFDTWFSSIKSAVKLTAQPGDLVAYWFIILAFIAITAHHMMLLIEYHVALMCAAVLLPWGLWGVTAPLAEFSVGWITGGLVRALVGTTMLGIAVPLFDLLNRPSTDIITLTRTFVLVGGAIVFCLLCWVIPARAAGIAGRGVALALHGGTLMSSAATFARFGLMASNSVRGFSRLVQAFQASRGALATGRP